MSNLVLAEVGQDGSMSSSGPRAGGPTPRRSFGSVQKLDFLARHEDACIRHEGGAFLRGQGLYSSQITEWRKLRDAGVLAGKKAGETIGKLSREQRELLEKFAAITKEEVSEAGGFFHRLFQG